MNQEKADKVIDEFLKASESSVWPEVSLLEGPTSVDDLRMIGWKTDIGGKSYGDAVFLNEPPGGVIEEKVREIMSIQASRSYARITGVAWEPEMYDAVKLIRR